MLSRLSYRDNALDAAPGQGCGEFLASGDCFRSLAGTDFRRKFCDAWRFDFVTGDNLTWPSVEMCCLAYHYAVARGRDIAEVHAGMQGMSLELARCMIKRHRMPRSKTEFWLRQGAAVRRHCLARKFCQSSHLRQLLLDTGSARLSKGKADACGHGLQLMQLRQLLLARPKGWDSVDQLEAEFHALHEAS